MRELRAYLDSMRHVLASGYLRRSDVLALELERIALQDEYFVKRKLYPNVDFYSGLIYQAMGLPTPFFPVLFAIPRTVGWLAQWNELVEDLEQNNTAPPEIYTKEEYDDWATAYLARMRTIQPRGPYLIGGMCEGALIAFQSVEGMTAPRLERLVTCHLARNACLDDGAKDVAYCPLALKNVKATVTQTADGLFAIAVRSDDPTVAEEILRRAQALTVH